MAPHRNTAVVDTSIAGLEDTRFEDVLRRIHDTYVKFQSAADELERVMDEAANTLPKFGESDMDAKCAACYRSYIESRGSDSPQHGYCSTKCFAKEHHVV
jgi:hypothetical protein